MQRAPSQAADIYSSQHDTASNGWNARQRPMHRPYYIYPLNDILLNTAMTKRQRMLMQENVHSELSDSRYPFSSDERDVYNTLCATSGRPFRDGTPQSSTGGKCPRASVIMAPRSRVEEKSTSISNVHGESSSVEQIRSVSKTNITAPSAQRKTPCDSNTITVTLSSEPSMPVQKINIDPTSAQPSKPIKPSTEIVAPSLEPSKPYNSHAETAAPCT